MSTNLYLVYSQKPEWVSRDDYHSWYVDHAQENIESPGFVSARRYAVTPATGSPGPFQHLALYEYDGPIERWRSDLDRRIASKEIDLPGFFPRIQFGAWDCHPVSGLLQPATHAGG